MDEDRYFLGLVRYIHQNPLRAGLVQDLESYPYSSHLCYLDLEQRDWVYRDMIYQRFGKSERVAIRKYAAFLDERQEDPALFRKGEAKPDIIGDNGFAERALGHAQEKGQIDVKWEDILQIVLDVSQGNLEDLKASSKQRKNTQIRAFIALLAEEFSVTSFQHLARFFNRDIVIISEGVKRLKNKIQENPHLQKQYELLRKQLTK